MIEKTFSYNPKTDITSLKGKVILITGANTGLGKRTASELAAHSPASLWMASRDVEKGRAAAGEVNSLYPSTRAHFLQLDLSSFDSIKTAAKTLLASIPRLDIVFLNAGIFGHPPASTHNGYEIHMGTNHLGHALLMKFLTPLLLKSASSPPSSDVRVVILTSIGYKNSKAQTIEFDTLKQPDGRSPAERYCQSKMANLLYAKGLARRFPELKTVAVHPGEVQSELFSREPGDEQIRYLQTEMVPKFAFAVEEGVKNQLWAATAHSGVRSGEYYEPVGVEGRGTGVANDVELAEELWRWTEEELRDQEI